MADSPWPLHAETLLGRAELPTDFATAASFLRGKRVLVTGAGGSVGQALSHTLVGFHPSSLMLLDHHEHSLFELSRRLSDPDLAMAPDYALADVRHERKLRSILQECRPEVVFHLAAYKHVPLAERFPDEAVEVNIFGTLLLLRLAEELGVECFLYPSSDKACNPPGLYGATKRLAETLVGVTARTAGRRFSTVRYVNIIGTQGSVIDTFADQLRRAQALTVTSPEMTRYWISMREALWLITSAASWAEPACVYMLDARQEVSVVDMARRVASVLGCGEPSLRFSGVRPGERLREELLGRTERFTPGPRPGVLTVECGAPGKRSEVAQRALRQLSADLEARELAKLKDHAMAFSAELQ